MNDKQSAWRRIGVLLLAAAIAAGVIVPASPMVASAAPTGPLDQHDTYGVDVLNDAEALQFASLDTELVLNAQAGGEPAKPVGSKADGVSAADDGWEWTPERMRAAKPLPLPTGGKGSSRSVDAAGAATTGEPGGAGGGPPQGRDQARRADMEDLVFGPAGHIGGHVRSAFTVPFAQSLVFPFSTAGKVFFRRGGSSFSCSAASIGGDAAWSAGHCVFTPGPGGGFHTNVVFVPSYFNGAAPRGIWSAARLWTTQAWIQGNQSFDYGGIILNTVNGQRLSQRVGFLGIAFNWPLGTPYTELGYPGQPSPRFNGQTLQRCDGRTITFDPLKPVPRPVGLFRCEQQQGSSGGPWIKGGTIWLGGNVSYGYPRDTRDPPVGRRDIVYSPYFRQIPGSNNDTTDFYNFLQAQKADDGDDD